MNEIKKQKRSKEEIEIEKIEKLKRKQEREDQKAKRQEEKEKRKKERENPPTERELVHKYVNRVITNQRNHGRVNEDKFEGVAHNRTENKNLWLDSEFYFSVVFQSSKQKFEFLDAIGWTDEEADEVEKTGEAKILNGLRLAERMGIDLKREEISKFPMANLDLMEYVLDNNSDEQD